MSEYGTVNRVSRIGPVVGRTLQCTRCHRTLDVLEAADGATTADEHRWIDPSDYLCGDCCLAGSIEELTAMSTNPGRT